MKKNSYQIGLLKDLAKRAWVNTLQPVICLILLCLFAIQLAFNV